jgi:hypothetical protein
MSWTKSRRSLYLRSRQERFRTSRICPRSSSRDTSRPMTWLDCTVCSRKSFRTMTTYRKFSTISRTSMPRRDLVTTRSRWSKTKRGNYRSSKLCPTICMSPWAIPVWSISKKRYHSRRRTKERSFMASSEISANSLSLLSLLTIDTTTHANRKMKP